MLKGIKERISKKIIRKAGKHFNCNQLIKKLTINGHSPEDIEKILKKMIECTQDASLNKYRGKAVSAELANQMIKLCNERIPELTEVKE